MAYHRLESSKQTPADAKAQVASGEIWGLPARWSAIPCVKAYRPGLPPVSEVSSSQQWLSLPRVREALSKLGGTKARPVSVLTPWVLQSFRLQL